MKIIIQILSLLLVSFVLNAQGADPHGNEDSAITEMVSSDIKNDKNFDRMENQKKITISEKVFTKDEVGVKSTIEKFLIVAGSYNLDAMANMMADKASLAIVRLRGGKWTTETVLIEDHLAAARKNTNQPYFEPVKEYTIHVSDGHLAFVKADAVLHAFGVPLLNNIDYFTLIKENEVWKFINISFTSTRIPEAERIFDLTVFAKS